MGMMGIRVRYGVTMANPTGASSFPNQQGQTQVQTPTPTGESAKSQTQT
jgi:hypothetical protein